MTSLAATLRDFGDEVEASLAYTGVDVLDLWRGRLSFRRLLVLLKYLPDEAPLWPAVRAAAEREQAEALAAHLRERTRFWRKRQAAT